jgi:hypothetical protein
VKRAGGWLLGLLVIAVMGAAGAYVVRRVTPRETATVVLFLRYGDYDPTAEALKRGARFALEETRSRAGHYRVHLIEFSQGFVPSSSIWLGTSEDILRLGDVQPPPFTMTVVDTHPWNPAGSFRITPGCDRQGKAAAAWAKKSGAARIVLLRDKSNLRSQAIATAFAASAQIVEEPLDDSLENVDRILAAKANLVFYSGEQAPYSTAYNLFAALRGKGYDGTLLMGDADPNVSFLAIRPDLLDGTYLVSPFAPAPPDLAARMGKTPGPHVTAGYLALKATLEAIDYANSTEPADLRRAAAKLPYFDAAGASTRPCALYVARNGLFQFVEVLK